MTEAILSDLAPSSGAKLLAFVNGLGGTPLIELYVVYNELAKQLADRGLTATRNLVGNYITSLEMAGVLDHARSSSTTSSRSSGMRRCTRRRCGGEPDRRVDAATVKRWLEGSAVALHEQRDYLTQLDAAIGDADHGTNMDRGFSSVVAKLDELDGAAAGQDAGHGRVDARLDGRRRERPAVGHSPAAGRPLARRRRDVRRRGARGALEAALDGVVELGAAQPGDKTMVDALEPAVRTLERTPRRRGLRSARRSPRRARRPRRGCRRRCRCRQRRAASYLGERSIGHQDPGATSTAMILRALEQAVAAEQ